VTLLDIGSDPVFRVVLWSCFVAINVIILAMALLPKCTCPARRVGIILRNVSAIVYVTSSVTLVALLGVDEGPASYTTSKQDCWNLLVAIGLYMCHGFWAWPCLLKYVASPTKMKVRWRYLRDRQIQHTVQTELEAFHAAPPLPAYQPVFPAPAVVGASDLGPVANAYVQAIRAGKADEVAELGGMGPSRLLVHAPATSTGFVPAIQNGMYQAQGGAENSTGTCTRILKSGDLATEDQEKLWNWALAFMAVFQAVHYGAFAYLSYIYVLRASS
jgi:hypothetical protein